MSAASFKALQKAIKTNPKDISKVSQHEMIVNAPKLLGKSSERSSDELTLNQKLGLLQLLSLIAKTHAQIPNRAQTLTAAQSLQYDITQRIHELQSSTTPEEEETEEMGTSGPDAPGQSETLDRLLAADKYISAFFSVVAKGSWNLAEDKEFLEEGTISNTDDQTHFQLIGPPLTEVCFSLSSLLSLIQLFFHPRGSTKCMLRNRVFVPAFSHRLLF